jgi:hypothetical protein
MPRAALPIRLTVTVAASTAEDKPRFEQAMNDLARAVALGIVSENVQEGQKDKGENHARRTELSSK